MKRGFPAGVGGSAIKRLFFCDNPDMLILRSFWKQAFRKDFYEELRIDEKDFGDGGIRIFRFTFV